MENWTTITHIWEGLENFRQLRRDIFRIGIKQISQASLDQFFPSYKFTLGLNSKTNFLAMLDKTLETASFSDASVKEDLINQKSELEKIEEDLVLKRTMKHFNYEFVFKEENNNLKGFVKVTHRSNPRHTAILEWQNTNDPILYLAESEDGHMRLHINYGDDGLAIIEENNELTYKWTHCLQEGYIDLVHAEFGSVLMSKLTKQLKLEHGNLAAVEAAKRASTIQENNKTLMENNIALMKIYQKQLETLI